MDLRTYQGSELMRSSSRRSENDLFLLNDSFCFLAEVPASSNSFAVSTASKVCKQNFQQCACIYW